MSTRRGMGPGSGKRADDDGVRDADRIGAPTAPAAEDTLKVTKKADTNDGTCNSDCSLREAVVAANADPDRDTIRVPAGTYKLTSPEGDLDIETEVSIEAVRGTAVIDGQNTDRVLEITASGEAFLSGLKIVDGRVQTGRVAAS